MKGRRMSARVKRDVGRTFIVRRPL